MTTDADMMEVMHMYRIDSAWYHIRAVTEGGYWRFTSSEAAMFFINEGRSPVTINCMLH